jgi:uncharacterized membrane protein
MIAHPCRYANHYGVTVPTPEELETPDIGIYAAGLFGTKRIGALIQFGPSGPGLIGVIVSIVIVNVLVPALKLVAVTTPIVTGPPSPVQYQDAYANEPIIDGDVA